MVGFFLVGAGFAALVSGPRLKKGLWLAVGLMVLWTTNLLRLLLIFWLGQLAGEHLAVSILHPVAGLVFFCLGVALMVLLLRPMGLGLASTAWPTPLAGVTTSSLRPAAPRVFAAAAIVAVAGAFLYSNQAILKSYDVVASASGEPKIASFLASPADPAGWQASYVTEYVANKPEFGQSSRWWRYSYTPIVGAPSDLSSTLPVTADVINSGGLRAFSNFGVEACYSFHGYTLRDVARVNLGNGISGQVLSYASGSGRQDWSLVYWLWPVKTAGGTRYERVILYLQNTAGGQVRVPAQVPGVSGLKGALTSANGVERRLIVNRAFLVTFAREVIAGQTKQTATGVTISSLRPHLPERSLGSAISPASRQGQFQSGADRW
jgi:exosortase/archaeosortase family protein